MTDHEIPARRYRWLLAVALLAMVLTGCGTFRNRAVVREQLIVSPGGAMLMLGDGRTGDAMRPEMKLIEIHDDTSASVRFPQAREPARLSLDAWTDLPMTDPEHPVRARLIRIDRKANQVTLEYEFWVEAGPPILRHL